MTVVPQVQGACMVLLKENLWDGDGALPPPQVDKKGDWAEGTEENPRAKNAIVK